MPTMSTVVLADREATPVNHSFVANNVVNGVAYLRNRAASGVPIEDKVLSISSRQAGKRDKDKIVLTVPIVQTQTVNGISTPVVVRNGGFEINFFFDVTATDQERKNIMGMAYSLLGTLQSQIVDVVVNRSPAR